MKTFHGSAIFFWAFSLLCFSTATAGESNWEGVLREYIAEDFKSGKTQSSFYLETEENFGKGRTRRVLRAVKFAEGARPAKIKSGARVKVDGLLLSGSSSRESSAALPTLLVTSASEVPVLQQKYNSIGAADTAVTGERKVLVLPVHFSTESLQCTSSELRETMFDGQYSVAVTFNESSFGALRITGKVADAVKIEVNAEGCAFDAWVSAAEAAATAAGNRLDEYDHVYFNFPESSSRLCGVAGTAALGGNRAASLGGCLIADVAAHEIGHNLGMHHSSTPTAEYGDFSDIMSSSNLPIRQFNGPHKVQMGWVPESRIQTVTKSGDYRISFLEFETAEPQVLRIARPGKNEMIYLSYRAAVGLDRGLVHIANFSATYHDRTNVHHWDPTTFARQTVFMASLPDQATYSSSVDHVSVTQLSHDGESSTVRIVFDSPQDTTSPTVQWIGPADGSTVNGVITLQVNAQDDRGVASVEYFVDGRLAARSESAPFSMEFETGMLPDGEHRFYAVAKDVAGNAGTTIEARLNIRNSRDTLPPIVTWVAPTSGSVVSGTVPLRVEAWDDVGVARVEFFVDTNRVHIAIDPPHSFAFDTRTIDDGNHTFHAVAYDNAGQRTSSEQISIVVRNKASSSAPVFSGPVTAKLLPGGAVLLRARGEDDGGERNLTYHWTAEGPRHVRFSNNRTHSAQTSVAFFSVQGIYRITVVIRDRDGLEASSTLLVTVDRIDPH